MNGDYIPSEDLCAMLRRRRERELLRANTYSTRPLTSAERLEARILEEQARKSQWADRLAYILTGILCLFFLWAILID